MTALYIITAICAFSIAIAVRISDRRRTRRRVLRNFKAHTIAAAKADAWRKLRWSVYAYRATNAKQKKQICLICKNPELEEVFKNVI